MCLKILSSHSCRNTSESCRMNRILSKSFHAHNCIHLMYPSYKSLSSILIYSCNLLPIHINSGFLLDQLTVVTKRSQTNQLHVEERKMHFKRKNQGSYSNSSVIKGNFEAKLEIIKGNLRMFIFWHRLWLAKVQLRSKSRKLSFNYRFA